MKRFCVCLLAVLIQAACIGVEDFGAYWNRGVIDPALEGTWKKIGLPGENRDGIPGPDQWRFTKAGSTYTVYAINPLDPTLAPDINEQRRKDSEQGETARSLKIGQSVFLMTTAPPGGGKGRLERYRVQGDTLEQYQVLNGRAVDFLKTRHPEAKNIRGNTSEGTYVVVETFDDEVFQILSEISDDPGYWELECVYQRLR